MSANNKILLLAKSTIRVGIIFAPFCFWLNANAQDISMQNKNSVNAILGSNTCNKLIGTDMSRPEHAFIWNNQNSKDMTPNTELSDSSYIEIMKVFTKEIQEVCANFIKQNSLLNTKVNCLEKTIKDYGADIAVLKKNNELLQAKNRADIAALERVIKHMQDNNSYPLQAKKQWKVNQ